LLVAKQTAEILEFFLVDDFHGQPLDDLSVRILLLLVILEPCYALELFDKAVTSLYVAMMHFDDVQAQFLPFCAMLEGCCVFEMARK